jgi:hypothetical protein
MVSRVLLSEEIAASMWPAFACEKAIRNCSNAALKNSGGGSGQARLHFEES